MPESDADEEAGTPSEGDHADVEPAEHSILVLLQMGSGPGSSLNRTVVQDIIQQMGGLSVTRSAGSRVDVWIDSPGGDAHAAYKLGLYLRSRYETVVFVIMDYAKSAATLLSLSADRIYMAPAAELGPLDTQESREGEVRMRSLLDTAESIDTIFTQAFVNAIQAGGYVLTSTALTREQTIAHVLDFAAQFSRPLLEQIDPIAVNAANTSLNVASEYGARLLSYRSGRDGLARAKSQTDQLVRQYPTHGYVIDRDEAREVLSLPVVDIEGYELLAPLEDMYSRVQKSEINVITLLDASQFQPSATTSNDEGESDGDEADDSVDGVQHPSVNSVAESGAGL